EAKLAEEKGRADEEQKKRVALEGWRQTAYVLQIAVALNEYRANNVGRTEQVLDECPKDLRHFEWHYLKRLCHSELSSVRLGEEGQLKVVWTDLRISSGSSGPARSNLSSSQVKKDKELLCPDATRVALV